MNAPTEFMFSRVKEAVAEAVHEAGIAKKCIGDACEDDNACDFADDVTNAITRLEFTMAATAHARAILKKILLEGGVK
jgi:hypothetical protein